MTDPKTRQAIKKNARRRCIVCRNCQFFLPLPQHRQIHLLPQQYADFISPHAEIWSLQELWQTIISICKCRKKDFLL